MDSSLVIANLLKHDGADTGQVRDASEQDTTNARSNADAGNQGFSVCTGKNLRNVLDLKLKEV